MSAARPNWPPRMANDPAEVWAPSYRIELPNGDWAEAYTHEAAMLAVETLIGDATRFLRENVVIRKNGEVDATARADGVRPDDVVEATQMYGDHDGGRPAEDDANDPSQEAHAYLVSAGRRTRPSPSVSSAF